MVMSTKLLAEQNNKVTSTQMLAVP